MNVEYGVSDSSYDLQLLLEVMSWRFDYEHIYDLKLGT